jgi:DNA-binding LacI/PurR family transcriptional regulator
MADVAKLAGVSQQTVSRVVNDSVEVRPETRERVRAAMRMLDYSPNSVARALATGRSRTLGVISYKTTLYGPASTLFAIERAAHLAGYHVSITSLRTSAGREALDAVERFRIQGVAGILVIAPQREVALALMRVPADVAVVAVESGPALGLPLVTVDNVRGAELATSHLLSLGHSTVWHVAGPADWTEAEQRISGWRTALSDAGAVAPPLLRGDWNASSGYALAASVPPEASAIFAANDQMALGLLRALREAGRSVPGDVSLVGFDDIPEASYFTPPLTTVRQDFMELGQRGLALLLREMDGRGRSARLETISPALVARASARRRAG